MKTRLIAGTIKAAAAAVVIAALPLLISNCGGGGGGGKLTYVPQNQARDCSSGPAGRAAAQASSGNYDAVQCMQIHREGETLPVQHGSTVSVGIGATLDLQAIVYGYGCEDMTSGFNGDIYWNVSTSNVGSITLTAGATATFTATSSVATGTITVTLYDGSTVVKTDTIDVSVTSNQPPTAGASANVTSGTAPLTVTFTGTCSDSDGSCVSYSWNFGDGSPASTSQSPSHSYTSAGTYTAVLTVTDDDGDTDTASVPITVSAPAANNPPTASPSANITSGNAPLAVNFTGGCTDADGSCVSYSWNFGDASPADSTQNPAHTYTGAGTYTAVLTVTDDDGATATGGVTITVTSATVSPRVGCGNSHTCFVAATGSVYCMGYNGNGQVGDNTMTDRNVPTPVSGITSGATRATGGEGHSCAVVSGGVKCWGDNSAGQLGNGTVTNSLVPVTVSGLSGVSDVKAGDYFTCALKSDGTVWCWGDNAYGQLGNNNLPNDSDIPVQVSGLTSINDITTGPEHACAQTTAGVTKCWGRNNHMQLGDTTTTDSGAPVALAWALTTAAVGAGGAHTCVANAPPGSTADCWGLNADSQVGGAAGPDVAGPNTVVSANTFVDISGGGSHTCAVCTLAGVWCWGNNMFGALGDNTTTTRTAPVQAIGVANADQVSAGGYHSCAATSDGKIYCWGNNSSGELGAGDNANRLTPVQVYP